EAPTAEAVHTLRVALRRLRAGLSILRRAAADGLDPPRDGLREAASLLGKARDWDVLLEGDGAALRGLFPEDGRVTRLLGAAERQRRLAYDAA
ncbi:CHAD domain-containing protein, partial [Glaesserella parasuis]|uniref:CHAD domain-containing protein n=1 Tax=Glaesserella parasuis TaxID=738 RepID=UPI003F3B0B44